MKASRSIIVRTCLVLSLLVALVGMLPPVAVQAADWIVTNTSDNDPGSLRQAIAAANPGDTITFDLPAYPETITLTSGELLIDKDLTITGPSADDLTISGDNNSRVFYISAGTVTISGLTITAGRAGGDPARGGGIMNEGTLTVKDCLISYNIAQGDAGTGLPAHGGDAQGGGIFSGDGSRLTVRRCVFDGNQALGGADDDGFGGDADGGAIGTYLVNQVTIKDSTLKDNTALGGNSANSNGGRAAGGAIDYLSPSSLTIQASILNNNTAQGGNGNTGQYGMGGCIFSRAPLIIKDSALYDNTARGGKGEDEGGGLAQGGALYCMNTTTLEDSTLTGNTARGGNSTNQRGGDVRGGGIYHWSIGPLTLRRCTLSGSVARGGEGGSGATGTVAYGGGLYSDGPATIEESILQSNTARGGDSTSREGGSATGGGIYNRSDAGLIVKDSDLRYNTALGGTSDGDDGGSAYGGAMYIDSGTAQIVTTILSENTAQGGDSLGANDGGDAFGGGLRIRSNFTLMIADSALHDNIAQAGASATGSAGLAQGGGYGSLDLAGIDSTATFTNCTISANLALSENEGQGGGVYTGSEGTFKLSFCTIAYNEADHQGGGIYSATDVDDTGPILKNTILSENLAPEGADLYQRAQSRGYILLGKPEVGVNRLDIGPPPNTGTGVQYDKDPRLGPLQDNGGPTWTHALLGDSPAIDAGHNTDIDGNPVDADQRGSGRPYGSEHDIGAYEWGPANLVIVKAASPDEAQPGQPLTFTLSLSNSGWAEASGILLTDTFPASLTSPTVVSSSLALTDTGASPPYVWQVQDLLPGHGGTITLTATLGTGLPAGQVVTNTATLTTTAEESDLDDNESSATITVLNTPPLAVDDSYSTTPGAALTVAAPGILTNDSDANGDALTAIQDSDPLSGTLALEADGSLVYTPTAGFSGTDIFTYHAHDGSDDSNVATVTISIEQVNVYLPLVLRSH